MNDSHPHHYTIHINKKAYTWNERLINGAQVKLLAGLPVDFQVVLIIPGHEVDPVIGDQEAVDLGSHPEAHFRVFRQTTTEG